MFKTCSTPTSLTDLTISIRGRLPHYWSRPLVTKDLSKYIGTSLCGCEWSYALLSTSTVQITRSTIMVQIIRLYDMFDYFKKFLPWNVSFNLVASLCFFWWIMVSNKVKFLSPNIVTTNTNIIINFCSNIVSI